MKITPGRLRDPQQINLYAYVRNNPFRFIDPDGEVLQVTGDVDEAMNQLCELIGGDCSRVSFDEKTNTITGDVTGIHLQKGAIIGAGYFANFHAEAWQNIEDATVIAVVDPLQTRAEEFAAKWKIPHVYRQAAELF